MPKNASEQGSVLGVCVEEPEDLDRARGLDFAAVRSGRRAIDMMRMLNFDLLMVGLDMPDMDTWDFVRRVRTGWAWQKWALVGEAITDEQEIKARMFGAVRIYDLLPSSQEVLQLASSLRRRTSVAVLGRDDDDRNYRSAAAF